MTAVLGSQSRERSAHSPATASTSSRSIRVPNGFPWATLAVNLSGSLALGFVFTLMTESIEVRPVAALDAHDRLPRRRTPRSRPSRSTVPALRRRRARARAREPGGERLRRARCGLARDHARPSRRLRATASGAAERDRSAGRGHVGRDEQPEVGRGLVREQLGGVRVAERAVQHRQLPEAVGLRVLDDRLEREDVAEPLLADVADDAGVVVRRRRVEAERAGRVVRVAVVGAGDERDPPALAGGGDRRARPDVLGQRELARRRDEDDRPRVPTEEPERDQRAPVERVLGQGRVVRAEAEPGGGQARRPQRREDPARPGRGRSRW